MTWLKAFMKNFKYTDFRTRSGLLIWGSSMTWDFEFAYEVLDLSVRDRLRTSLDCEYEDAWEVKGFGELYW